MKPIYKLLLVLFIGSYTSVLAQMESYSYKKEIKGVDSTWHSIALPNSIFSKTNAGLSDLRIYGITAQKDTIQAPYLMQDSSSKSIEEAVSFTLLNVSRNSKGSYYTFEISNAVPINEMDLHFSNPNFDWNIRLEGTNDQQEWYTLLDDYRIVGMKNEAISFQYAKLRFPNSRYRYYRVQVKTKDTVAFSKASIQKTMEEVGDYTSYTFASNEFKAYQDKGYSVIELALKNPIRMHQLALQIKNDFDYYRPARIYYATDSVATQKGISYRYQSWDSNVLHSEKKTLFSAVPVSTNRIKIKVFNGENPPLNYSAIVLKEPKYSLIARFSQEADYFLCYGKPNARKPNFDIQRFTNKIPENLTAVTLGEEEEILSKKAPKEVAPLFQNSIWLWALMILIIAVLGVATFRMIQKKDLSE